jgi:membrane-associated phospholipid phosphatase
VSDFETRRGDAATRRRGDTNERGASAADSSNSQATAATIASDARDIAATSAADSASHQRALKPVDLVVIAYLAIIAALILIFRYRIEWWPHLVAAHALGIALVTLLAKWAHTSARRVAASPRRRVVRLFQLSRFLKGWYLVPLIPTTFKELSYVIPLLHARDFDVELAAIDYRVFGAHPTVWIERILWPPLTEVLQFAYATYYFLPVALGVVLWSKRRFAEFDFWIFIIAFGFYLSYIGYIIVPAIGPRFLPQIKDAQTAPLAGVWLFQTLREMLDKAEGITRDCFPSGHTELTLLSLYYARRLHRPTFWAMLPIGSAIIFSTVYLRYHYVIDVVAGALLAVLVVMMAKFVYRQLGGSVRKQSAVGSGQSAQ